MCAVLQYYGLKKQKISICCFLFLNIGTSRDRTEQSFQVVCFNLAQVKASVELCINKLSDAAAKSELEANCEKFDSDLGELGTLDGLADSCVKWHGALEGHRSISKLIVPIHKKEDRNKWTNHRGISLLSLPERVYGKMSGKYWNQSWIKGACKGGWGWNPPWDWHFTKTLLRAQGRLIVFAYFLLVNLST